MKSLIRACVFFLVSLTLVGSSPRSRLSFPSALFIPVVTANPALQARWAWPSEAVFREKWTDAERMARPFQVVIGRVEDGTGANDEVALAIADMGKTYLIEPIGAATREAIARRLALFHRHVPWTLIAGRIEVGKAARFADPDGNEVGIRPRYVSPKPTIAFEAFTDWVYVAGLLESDEGVYETSPSSMDPAWIKLLGEAKDKDKDKEYAGLLAAALQDDSAFEGRGSDRDWKSPRAWDQAAIAAIAVGDLEFARQIYRRFEPFGRCSMDSYPGEVARRYADVCYQMGRTGCYLQLSIQIMGNQFSRAVTSSYGDAALESGAERLSESGLDIDRFLIGLMTQFGTEKPREREIDLWRLARSVVDAGRTDAFAERLRRMTQDTGLDEYNRTLAAITLAYVRMQVPRVELHEKLKSAGRPGSPQEVSRDTMATVRAEAFEELGRLKLTPATQVWMEGMLSSK